MASGIKVNLDEIEKIAKKYETGSSIDDLIGKCYGRIYTVKNYYKYYNSETYKEQKKIINDIESSMRAINDNIQEVSGGLSDYVKKMNEEAVVFENKDVFVAKDQTSFEEQFAGINEDIMNLKTSCSQMQANHLILIESLSFNVFHIKESVEELLDKKEIKSLYNNFMSVLYDISDSDQLELKVDEILNNYEHITEWYDRDYDASDHIKHVAGIAAQGTFEAIVVVVAVGLGAELMVGAAIAAGMTETLNAIKEYDDGARAGEAASDGLEKFAVDLAFIVGAGEVEILAKTLFETPQVRSYLIKYGVGLEEVTTDSLRGIANNTTYTTDITVDKLTWSEAKSITSDVMQGKLRDTSIEGLNEYFKDEYGLQLDDEQLKIMQGMVGIISEISI